MAILQAGVLFAGEFFVRFSARSDSVGLANGVLNSAVMIFLF